LGLRWCRCLQPKTPVKGRPRSTRYVSVVLRFCFASFFVCPNPKMYVWPYNCIVGTSTSAYSKDGWTGSD
jgi:hypothetical protein